MTFFHTPVRNSTDIPSRCAAFRRGVATLPSLEFMVDRLQAVQRHAGGKAVDQGDQCLAVRFAGVLVGNMVFRGWVAARAETKMNPPENNPFSQLYSQTFSAGS